MGESQMGPRARSLFGDTLRIEYRMMDSGATHWTLDPAKFRDPDRTAGGSRRAASRSNSRGIPTSTVCSAKTPHPAHRWRNRIGATLELEEVGVDDEAGVGSLRLALELILEAALDGRRGDVEPEEALDIIIDRVQETLDGDAGRTRG